MTSNVPMSVIGSIFCGMEFKNVYCPQCSFLFCLENVEVKRRLVC